jgi:5-methylcytosine-specific restriction endonuclease McrA
MATYQRAGGDKRGNAAARRARKNWLLSQPQWQDSKLGTVPGESCACVFQCGTVLTYATVEADRIVAGGSYRRENVQPACRPCNLARSDDDLTPQQVAERVRATFLRTGRLTPALAVA